MERNTIESFRIFLRHSRVSTSRKNFQPYYYQTGAGAEIDLIIESAKGMLPIERKF